MKKNIEEHIDETKQKMTDIRDICAEQDQYARVKNVKYIGKITIRGEQKEIYSCELYTKGKEGELIELERVYTEDLELIAANNKENNYGMLLSKEHMWEDNLLEQIKENMEKELKIEKLERLNEKEISNIAIELGVSEEDLKRMVKVNIEDKDENEIVEDDIEQNTEENAVGNIEKNMEEQDENATPYMTIDPDVKVTERETMASMLNVEAKGYERFEVVPSKDVKDSKNNTQFSIVGVREENGKKIKEEIETLKQVEGNVPFKNVNAMNQDGSKIEDTPVQSLFEIKGREDEQIAIGLDEYNTPKASLVRHSRETNEYISVPIEANTIENTRHKPKELMNSHANPNIDNEAKKILEHEGKGYKDYEIEDIDENSLNDIHTYEKDEYIPETDMKWIEFANGCGYRGEGAIEAAKRTFDKAKSEAPEGATNEEVAKDKIEKTEEEFEHRETNEIN